MNLLTVVIALPLVAFLVALLLPKAVPALSRWLALGASLVIFLASLALVAPWWSGSSRSSSASGAAFQAAAGFQPVSLSNDDAGASRRLYEAMRRKLPDKANGFQFEVDLPWIDSPRIHYHVGIDGVSLWLILLTTLLTPICVLLSWRYIDRRPKEFYAFLLLLEFGLIGVFCSLDLFLFYVFWEVSLVPMYFLIGVWGYDRRIYAAVKFFLYTMAGSVLMLAAMIFLYTQAGGTFDYIEILRKVQTGQLGLTSQSELLLFLAFFIAFAIKVPLFPLHTWLPDAHVEAPTAGSVMLASVMLKMGTYGLLRFCLPMFPNAAHQCADWIITLAIIGIIYGALVAMVQPNMKKLVAYSSVSHLGFVVLGLFSFTQAGMDGAVYQMLNHGISTGALFLLVGFLNERRHSLEISAYGGVATVAPGLAQAFMITMLASIGLPTLNNFIGEFLVLQGAALANFKWAIFAAIGVILSACYMLWLYQRVFFGRASDDLKHHMYDLNAREWACIVPLVVMMVWMGCFTQTFMPPISTATAGILEKTKTTEELHVRTGRSANSGTVAELPRHELAAANPPAVAESRGPSPNWPSTKPEATNAR